MAQFGAGTELAAQCPRLPPPDGWRPWGESDGPIPDELQQRAIAVSNDLAIPLGASENFLLPGTRALIRAEPHAWKMSTSPPTPGCFHAAVVYLPAETIRPPESNDRWSRTVTVLTAISLVVGIGATLATWGRR